MRTRASRQPRGFRTHGVLSPNLLIALDEQAHRAASATDPATLVRAVGLVLAAMDDELRRFTALRAAALATLRKDGASYDGIASATGLSKARVAQLSRSISAPHRPDPPSDGAVTTRLQEPALEGDGPSV